MDKKFKKTFSIVGKFKLLTANGGTFLNEDGEEVPVADLIEQAMGSAPFDLSVSTKTEEEV